MGVMPEDVGERSGDWAWGGAWLHRTGDQVGVGSSCRPPVAPGTAHLRAYPLLPLKPGLFLPLLPFPLAGLDLFLRQRGLPPGGTAAGRFTVGVPALGS